MKDKTVNKSMFLSAMLAPGGKGWLGHALITVGGRRVRIVRYDEHGQPFGVPSQAHTAVVEPTLWLLDGMEAKLRKERSN